LNIDVYAGIAAGLGIDITEDVAISNIGFTATVPDADLHFDVISGDHTSGSFVPNFKLLDPVFDNGAPELSFNAWVGPVFELDIDLLSGVLDYSANLTLQAPYISVDVNGYTAGETCGTNWATGAYALSVATGTQLLIDVEGKGIPSSLSGLTVFDESYPLIPGLFPQAACVPVASPPHSGE
jgi:hypothetical protein